MTIPRYKWQPTTAEIADAAGIDPGDVVRFDHNTTPWRAEWAVELAAETAPGLNEYPGASYRDIREAAARRHGLDPDQIVPGAGADELILLAARAFLGVGKRAATMAPTYPLYRIACAQVGAELNEVQAVAPDFAAPIDALIDAAREADVMWLCIPNNPTAVEIDRRSLGAIIAATDGVVIVDAAYAEFVGDDWASEIEKSSNLIVLRTLSKAFGLAGARVGYAMGHPSLIDRFDALRPPGSIATPSAALAAAALARADRAAEVVEMLEPARRQLTADVASLGFRVLPSQVNFILCEVGSEAPQIAADLRATGLVVRTFPEATGLQCYLRFTVRSPDENARLIATLKEVLA